MSNALDLIMQLAAENNGILFASDASKQGISRESLRQAKLAGLIENVSHGVYITAETLPDDAFILQRKYGKAIFSHETAAYFLGFTTRDPLVFSVTVPSGYNSRLLTDGNAKIYYSAEINQEDIVVTKTMFGREVRCFNIEKTIVDFCSGNFKGDKDVALEVIKAYARSKSKNISKLMNYATTKKAKDTIRGYMEALL